MEHVTVKQAFERCRSCSHQSVALSGSMGFVKEKRLHKYYLNGNDVTLKHPELKKLECIYPMIELFLYTFCNGLV